MQRCLDENPLEGRSFERLYSQQSTVLQVGRPVLNRFAKGADAKRQYRLRRLADAWRYGSGSDFKH